MACKAQDIKETYCWCLVSHLWNGETGPRMKLTTPLFFFLPHWTLSDLLTSCIGQRLCDHVNYCTKSNLGSFMGQANKNIRWGAPPPRWISKKKSMIKCNWPRLHRSQSHIKKLYWLKNRTTASSKYKEANFIWCMFAVIQKHENASIARNQLLNHRGDLLSI